MKRMMTAGILALSLCALAEQNASAWVNHKFGIGLNWNWQSGGNNFLWGLFRNGQPPGPGCDAGGCPPGGMGGPGCLPGAFPGGGYPGAGGGHFPGFVPPGNIYGPQDFQYFGKQQQQQQQQPGTAATSQADQGAAQGVSNQLYRTSSYSSYGYGYYPYANYYYGNYYSPYSYGANR